jgi:hypothetical protein
MLIAGLGTEMAISGHIGRISRILKTHIEAEIIEGPQIGRIVELTFQQVETAAGYPDLKRGK